MSVHKSRSVKKKMVAVLYTARSIVKSIMLDSQKRVTGKWYTEGVTAHLVPTQSCCGGEKLYTRPRLNISHYKNALEHSILDLR